MIGKVDQSGRALLAIKIVTDQNPSGTSIDAWIDTGFTGDLVLPELLVQQLSLPVSGSIDCILADGSQVELKTYHCRLSWFGSERSTEVIVNSGEVTLLGVGLLLAKELRVDYTNPVVSLLPSAMKS